MSRTHSSINGSLRHIAWRPQLGMLALVLAGSAAPVAAQQCVGLPSAQAMTVTVLRDSPGRLTTMSGTMSTALGRTPLFAIGEIGRISAASDLLPQTGNLVTATLGASWVRAERWYPCVTASVATGTAPSATGVDGASLAGTVIGAGVGYDLLGVGPSARATLFASWAHAMSKDAGADDVLRGGVALAPWRRLLLRLSVAQVVDQAHGYAYGISVGLHR